MEGASSKVEPLLDMLKQQCILGAPKQGHTEGEKKVLKYILGISNMLSC